MNQFAMMCRDVVTLVKPDGRVFEEIKANVQSNQVTIFDTNLPIEEDDKIFRPLPSGLVESFIITDRGYHASFNGIPDRYTAKTIRESSIDKDKYERIINIYQNGNFSKVNIDTIDKSVNNIDTNAELFTKLISSLQEIIDQNTREKAIILANEMRSCVGDKNYITKYQDFIAIMANQITIIAPFLPSLTALLS